MGDPTAGGWDAPEPHAATPAWAEQRPVQAAEAFPVDGPPPVGEEAAGAAQPAPGIAPEPPHVAPEAPPVMAEDDVLAQIGRLSPKAAEAIAAALGDGGDRGTAG